MALLDRALVRMLPAVPKPVVQRLSARYIAGADLADARRVVAELNAAGKMATVDVLGEEITNPAESEAIADEYVAALDAFEADGLDANVSVKPTALGLKLDYDLCRRNVERVIAAAEPTDRFVRLDMVEAATADDTLRLFRELRDAGHGRVGPVLQASLRRTVEDARSLAGASVRLCKGIYVESDEIQFRDPDAATILAMGSAGGAIGQPALRAAREVQPVAPQPGPIPGEQLGVSGAGWIASVCVTAGLIAVHGIATWRLRSGRLRNGAGTRFLATNQPATPLLSPVLEPAASASD